MKYFVTGVNGQLGYDVCRELQKRHIDFVASDITPEYAGLYHDILPLEYVALDITDKQTVENTLQKVSPSVIIHCAAWTAVDAAEDEANKPRVWAVNVSGTANLARVAASTNAKIVYISTDYVFDGSGSEPWKADQQNFAPLNVYGASKLAGEKAVASETDKFFIVRIAWVFGKNGNNFIKTMLKIARTHDTLRVVCDQIGNPTYTEDLSRLLVDMTQTEKFGYYHATNEGEFISWADFAKEIFAKANLTAKVIPVTTHEYGLSKAKRPFNSRLDKSKLTANGFTPLPHWKDAIKKFIMEVKEN
ncbi:MAG: dTDP-4-dehydrorhamnose reductase [Synergistaceae bacterium]|nr:dTDP-4-dehydrorhamnose reductase [Synergistaceae bacterium]